MTTDEMIALFRERVEPIREYVTPDGQLWRTEDGTTLIERDLMLRLLIDIREALAPVNVTFDQTVSVDADLTPSEAFMLASKLGPELVRYMRREGVVA